MAYSRSPPQSPPEEWISPKFHSMKTYSSSSSRSYGSRSQSYASSNPRVGSSAHYENTARIYYLELSTYLKDLLDQESIEGPSPQRIPARQKLSKLTYNQFHELAMDVYDEVVRRRKNDQLIPFLPVNEAFHPKRNQARQKLATLAEARFQDLASDVYFELSRRYMLGDNELLPPVPQIPTLDSKMFEKGQTQSSKTHIVPVKGMMNLESFSDDDETILNSPETYKSSFQDRSILSTLRDHNSSNESLEKMRAGYEYQIHLMKNQIKHLQEKTDGSMESLSKKEVDTQTIYRMEQDYKALDDQHQKLKQEYQKQQQAVMEVKRETKETLVELKRLAQLNEELVQEKETATTKIQSLELQLKQWQTKYEKSKIELRTVRGDPRQSLQPGIKENSFLQPGIKENSFLQPSQNGVISFDHILTYQTCVNELLTAARSSQPTHVIQVMKNMVTVCKTITQQVETNEVHLSGETTYSLYELKTRFSKALSDLLVAAKHHASGMGISPVSLLDSAAGHLTAVMVDLAKLMGMRKHEESSWQETPGTSQAVSYLKKETETIVQTVQELLAALRLPPPNDQVHGLIETLIRIVHSHADLARSACQAPYPFHTACTPIVRDLDLCAQRLATLQQMYTGGALIPSAKRELAQEAYDIAKFTKELIHLFETN
ncbi:hypothetical protein BY458DRAFT_514136 [Sporodiniella umbellata]|nr:hypothetical protein BY458DRAFT_514136 [Sporodiniella umbellata]